MKDVAVRRARFWYRLGAYSNFACTVPAFIVYDSYVNRFFKKSPPNYPFLVRIWSGMAFLWGVSFLEIARDPERAYPLLKYTWLEKSVTSASVLTAFAAGAVPGSVAAGVVVTDVIWIPLFLRVHLGLSRELDAEQKGRPAANVES